MRFDVIVVGAGSAGCVVAKRLAEAHLEVLLLEAGGADSSLLLRLPIGYSRTMFDPRFSWRFVAEPEPGLNDRVIEHPRGKVLGGTSSINGMAYVRGDPSDYDQWARRLNSPKWSYENVLPLFRKSERNLDLADPLHGTDGEMPVSSPKDVNPFMEAFIASAMSCGVPRTTDFNGPFREGVGYFQATCSRGLRYSASRSFLRPSPDGLEIKLGRHVNRILFEGDRAVGVETVGPDGAIEHWHANDEIILCAGAIGSPKILQLSGVGPRERLGRSGIDVLFDNPHVGRNLQDHVQARIIVRSPEHCSVNGLQRSWVRRVRAASDYVLRRRGEFTIGGALVGLFARVGDNASIADTQIHVIPFSTQSPGRLHPFGGIIVSACVLRPASRGSVMLKSGNPLDPPEIRFNYLSHPDDLPVLRRGLRLAHRILTQPGMQGSVLSFVTPHDLAWECDDAVDTYIRSAGSTLFHPVGTCAMTASDDGVVDDALRVLGVRGLRVADASVMPTLVSGNTHAACVMIGERCAEEFLATRAARSAQNR
ncbi:MAG: GMC family oxidoreductase N-terminal domain-containing protein [Burkholderiales bacterium]|nr:GMC family oxidoreductase N-terminal domain-containing protein [Burkholderiales bacterium]